MPELPEAEAARKLAEKYVRNRRIEKVFAADDEIVFEGIKPKTFTRKLKGRTFKAMERKGKQMWARMDEGPHPTFHFGMTGSFEAYGPGDERPRFVKVEFQLDDGTRFAMLNRRRLGRIRLLKDPANEPPVSDLGFDPYLDLPTAREFVNELHRRKGNLKGLLLNQSFAAGIGNWIADEILYHSRIDPRRKTDSLSEAEAKRVHTALKKIIHKAVEVDADKDRFPKTWLFHHRWGKNEEAKTSRGEKVEFITVAGRTTAWVPSRQS